MVLTEILLYLAQYKSIPAEDCMELCPSCPHYMPDCTIVCADHSTICCKHPVDVFVGYDLCLGMNLLPFAEFQIVQAQLYNRILTNTFFIFSSLINGSAAQLFYTQ